MQYKFAGIIENLNDAETVLMETAIDWRSRHIYPSFLKKLGVDATMAEKVQKYGYAYSVSVANFDALLAYLGIKDKKKTQVLLDSLTETIKTVPPNEFNRNISNLLKELATDVKKVPLEKALMNIESVGFAWRFLNETPE